MGFFGLTTGSKGSPQPRWKATVDIDEAHLEVRDILEVWRTTSLWPDAPAFSGGVWDSWPKRLAEGLAFLKAEAAVVMAYLRYEEEKPRG